MKITVLADNNTLIDTYFLAEPGLSLHIEESDTNTLFDAGYSDVFLTNARRMNLSLLDLDWVALSHGHLDHTWGLDALIRHFTESDILAQDRSRPRLLAHPNTFQTKDAHDLPEIGSLMDQSKLARHFDMALTTEPHWITDRLVWLGEIETVFDFEQTGPHGRRHTPDTTEKDRLDDDTGLAYVGEHGLTVISGCAHSGICSTIERAKAVTGEHTVHTVLGGFHLLDATPARLDPTTDYLAGLDLDALYACHCTDLAAKIALARQCPVREVGSGLELKIA